MKHKFKVGEYVKIVEDGWGCNDIEIGKIVRIVETGKYACNKDPGYKVSPPIGNSLSGEYDGFIGEKSFESVRIVQTKVE